MAGDRKKKRRKASRRKPATKPKPRWKLFEEAVAAFTKALDPGATVEPDKKVPDINDGRPRQVDVWIQGRICGIPIRIVGSCKHWNRKISKPHVSAFQGEINDLGAHAGVFFTKRGFYRPAIEAAARKRISCCQMFDGTAPDLPDSLRVRS